MSLIQEALKRQQEDGDEENNNENVATTPVAPVSNDGAAKEILPGISAAPPPIAGDSVTEPPPIEENAADTPPPPPAALAEPAKEEKPVDPPPTQTPILKSTKASKKPNPLLIGVLVLAIIFIGLKVLKKPAAENDGNDPAIEAGTEETTVVEDTVTAPVEEAVIITPEELVDKVVEEIIEEPPAVTSTGPKKIEWPPLTLTAVMGKGKKGSAVINGEMYGVGDDIAGVVFESVGKNSINLKYKGESRSLRRGQTIY